MLLGNLLSMIGGIIFNDRSGNGVEFQENTRRAKRTQAQIVLVWGTVLCRTETRWHVLTI